MMTKCSFIELIMLLLASTGMPNSAAARTSSSVAQTSTWADASAWVGETGIASYYGAAHNGHLAADGSRFNQIALTAAHPWLPFGTKVRVTLASTGRSVVVTITDRLYSKRRIVDLSLAAAHAIGIIRQGIGQVSLDPA